MKKLLGIFLVLVLLVPVGYEMLLGQQRLWMSVQNDEGTLTFNQVVTPFHYWSGHIYLVVLHYQMIDGLWVQQDYQNQDVFKVGPNDSFSFIGSDNYRYELVLFCSKQEISSVAEARTVYEAQDRQHVWLNPGHEGGQLFLICD